MTVRLRRGNFVSFYSLIAKKIKFNHCRQVLGRLSVCLIAFCYTVSLNCPYHNVSQNFHSSVLCNYFSIVDNELYVSCNCSATYCIKFCQKANMNYSLAFFCLRRPIHCIYQNPIFCPFLYTERYTLLKMYVQLYMFLYLS